MKNRRIILVLALLCLSGSVIGQTKPYYTIDLATILSGTKNVPDTKTGIIKINEEWGGDSLIADGIRILSPLYSTQYAVIVGTKATNYIEDEFELSQIPVSLTTKRDIDTATVKNRNIAYDNLRISHSKYAHASSEKEIPKLFLDLTSSAAIIHDNNIVPATKADSVLLMACDKIISNKNLIEFEGKIRAGKNTEITIVVTRPGLTIEIKIKMPEKKQRWYVHYGFTYSPQIWNPAEQFYSKSDTGSSFLITRMHGGRKSFLDNFTPTMQFSYSLCTKWNVTPTMMGGIGLDFSNPTAMFGLGLMFGQNLSISSGIITARRDFLKGDYSEGQRLNSSISFDDLHRKMYVPELFFSIGFRFKENPFSKDEKKE